MCNLRKLNLEVMKMRATSTGWVVTALGAAITAAGATVLKGSLGAGAIGFGAAHILLGLLDMSRPSVRNG